MKVFYSWQSDTDPKSNRYFIRDALETAIAGLGVEDADRPEIDQDTKGVLGSPVITDTIFDKIRHAKVVVADVTLTGQTPSGKHLCNSNVAIELGYALGTHGPQVLLKVMNTHYGPPQNLPFDLAHRRWPVQYNLSPSAGGTERKSARDALANQLKPILMDYLAVNRPTPELFVPTPSTDDPAAYWQPSDRLGTSSEDNAELRYAAGQTLIYLRIWPREKIAPLTSLTLNDYQKSVIEPLCGTPDGWSHVRNRFGTLAYSHSRGNGQLHASTQVLKTGEIWGVNHYLLRERPEREHYSKFVPTGAFETRLRTSLNKYLSVARTHLGYPSKIMVESGLVNVADYRLALPDRLFDGFSEPIFENVRVTSEITMEEPETIVQALLRIFEAVYEAAGTVRPKDSADSQAKN